jgi:aspartate kinase
MIVMKFGGTSTQDAEAISNVVRIVGDRRAAKPMLVISAIAQATNVLEQAGKLASVGRAGEGRDGLLKLFDRHYAIVDALIKDRQRHLELRKVLAASLGELEEIVKGVAILGELTPRTLDTFYSYGELLSSRIVAAALVERGIGAEWLDTKDFMLTDENFNRAAPVWPIVEERLNTLAGPLLARGIVPVTQGFIGVTAGGRRTTMGRESSDYSAAIVGTVLRAEDIQIWTDVDGVLTADPRVVRSPRKIKHLSFEEAYELSYFGAKVLHPKTMLPAFERNIPIHIYNSRRPHLSGTCVSTEASSAATIVKSVAYKRGVVLFTVTPKKRLNQYMLWEHIYSILTRHDAAASMTVTSEQSSAFVLEEKNPVAAIAQELADIGEVTLHEGKGIVCVVGSNLRQSPRLAERVFRAIGAVGVAMVSFGASPSNLSFVINDEAVPDAVRGIHAEFFEPAPNEELFEQLEHVAQPA